MKEKLNAILHRRRKSTPSQSPRASYEKSEDGSPRAEKHPASPTQRNPPASRALNAPSHHTGRSRPLGSVYNDERISSPTAAQPAMASNADVNGSIADDYRSYLPVLSSDSASGEQHATLGGDRRRTIEENDGRHGEKVADRNTNRYKSSLDAERQKPLPAVPGPLGTANGGIRRVVDSSSDDESPRTPPDVTTAARNIPVRSPHAITTMDGTQVTDGDRDWKAKQASLLEGVVDLKNTVDTDRDTQWAPAVTHEVVKPHEHEIIQHQLFREMHNYTYYHRLQPVLQTEVLPPRHFIPNPNGEGLIEISADELPHRTGRNRWWDIVQKETPIPEATYQWRTEPEVIEGAPYMTEEGFERRETTIIYPPTLDDMSSYRGVVQPVHFDHKTGRRWLGEVTTLDKLRPELEAASDADFMTMKDVTANLPEVPSSPTVKRKPVVVGSA